jgi:hypothetical protein
LKIERQIDLICATVALPQADSETVRNGGSARDYQVPFASLAA